MCVWGHVGEYVYVSAHRPWAEELEASLSIFFQSYGNPALYINSLNLTNSGTLSRFKMTVFV